MDLIVHCPCEKTTSDRQYAGCIMLTHQVTWTTAAEGFPRPQRSHSEGSHYGFEENQQILGNMLKTWDIWGKKGGKFKKITHAATHTYVSA